SRAISSGVTGSLCCFASVSTPFSAQVMTALSFMKDFRCYLLFEHDLSENRYPLFRIMLGFDRARVCVARQPASCVHPLSAGPVRPLREIARSREPEKIARGFRP